MKILLREVHVVGPDYAHAYVWVAPVLMNPKRCEVIETFVTKVRGVTQTGCGGDHQTLRPFVFAVVNLQARGATLREHLARVLEEVGAPSYFIQRVRDGVYDHFRSTRINPHGEA